VSLTRNLLNATVGGALGGLLFGFDTAVISGTLPSLTATFHFTPWTKGVTVFIALLGTIVGAMSAGVVGQRIGSRETLRLLAAFYLFSSLGCAAAWNWHSLVLFRFVAGLAIGGSSVLAPVYIAELSPAQWRGRLVGAFQINIVAGILIAYLSNYVIARQEFGTLEWRWQFGVAALPAAIFLALLFRIPRSPRWLATQRRLDEARSVLALMGSPDPDSELRDIVASIHLETLQASEALFIAKYRFPIFLAVSVAMFNQLSGINAILYYLNDIFAAAGFSKISAGAQAIAIGAMNFAATLAGMALIDKIGRKTLLLIGSVGTFICLGGVARFFFTQQHSYWLLFLLLAYIAFFAMSQGAVIWVYIGEVFPNRVRAKGQSLGCSTHWIMNALISLTFPLLAKSSGAYPFAFFAAIMALQFFVVLFVYPETKGVTLERMQQELGIE
jgi:MFS transporter, SP family, arabinose:H+ symporter